MNKTIRQTLDGGTNEVLNKWGVYYKGKIAAVKLTRKGAQAYAFDVMKTKGWNQMDVEVKQMEAK